jgi:hypothetical protein
VTFAPKNTFVNGAGCQNGDYQRPIVLGENAIDVTIAEQ